MDIVVLAKFVPDINRVPSDAWDRERGTLIRSRLEMEFNPLDRAALRLALDVRAARPDTRVLVLSMCPPEAITMLREALAYGADRAVLLTDRRLAGSDTIATAYALAAAIRSLVSRRTVDSDFAVFCGMQSPDGDTAQVPAQVACFLDAPLYPYVAAVRPNADSVELKCLDFVGFQRVVIGRRPFVATATLLCPDLPFYVDLAAMRRANAANVLTWSRDDVELDDRRIGLEGSRTRVIRIFEPERKHRAGRTLRADAEDFPTKAAGLVAELRTMLKRGARDAGEANPPAEATARPSYYRGDCVALCEIDDGRVAPVSLEIMSACARMARQLSSSAVALVWGPASSAVATALRDYGAERVWFLDGMDEKVYRVRERARAVAALLRELQPQIVVAPATLRGRVLAPYVSALLDCGLTADCSGLEVADFSRSGRTFANVLHQTRPALGGNIMATIVSIYDPPDGRPQMATVRPGALPLRRSAAARCQESIFRVPGPPEDFSDRISVERRPEKEKQIDLGAFEVIVCVGMGVGSREAVRRVVEPFRAALERFLSRPVGLGCSRAMVDAGVLSHPHQIGQTGIVVKPAIYIGVGVSGAIQHKIGMENSRTIVSINRDAEARMHGFADVSIVGEVERVLPVLTAAMQSELRGALPTPQS